MDGLAENPTASLFDLKGKTALVTGATGRLGREISTALADMGANLALVARTEEHLTHLKDYLESRTGVQVLTIMADVHHEKVIREIFHRVQEVYGGLDILVNNVTGNAKESVENMTEASWNTALEKIVGSMFFCCQQAQKLMARHQQGSIINISSIYGVVAADQRIYGDSGLNSSVAYGTGKAAVIQLTRYLAAYWADQGIRVNSITPGGVEDATNDHVDFRQNYEARVPMQRMMRREEIRGAISYLASQASSYMTGHNLVLDGGFTLV